MHIHPMWQAYPSLEKELDQTLTLMEKTIQLNNPTVQEAVLEMIHAGGKLLRPAYQLLFSQFGKEKDKDSKKTIALAASIEMLHTATLIHDDIVDQSDLRRGLPTIQAKFGTDTAVYAGDYLFVCCFKLLSDYASSLKSIQLNSRSMEKVLTGELSQMNRRYDYSGGVEAYLENISGKTAELFALSSFIGAYEAGCSQKFSNNCRQIGLNIGLAFQMIDDILDYDGTRDTLGKPVLEDVRQGVYSLPLLLALEENKAELLPLLSKKGDISDSQVQEVYQLVQRSNGVKKARQMADDYTQKALKAIEKLPTTPQNTKEILGQLTTQILKRKS